MSEKIHPSFVIKLKKQKETYKKVTAFAERLPMFSQKILDNEYTGETFFRLTDRYKSLPLNWGVNWFTNTPTNYPEGQDKPDGLICVYINVISLFGDFVPHSFGYDLLKEARDNISVHFYDSWNSTFYFLPEELEDGLEKLNQWYIETKAKIEPYVKQKKKEELEKQLKELE